MVQLQTIYNCGQGVNVDKANHAIGIIIGIFQVAAVGVASIMLVVIAIKYMSSSPSEKAEIKKHAVVYIVGAVMAYGSAGVIQILKAFVSDTGL